MEQKDNLLVEGYRFGSLADARAAEEEAKKADYFRGKIAGRNPRSLLAVYDKMVDEKIFSTPVGWEYLRELQRRLLRAGIPKEDIRPIPMYATYVRSKGEGKESAFARQRIRPSRTPKINGLHVSIVINLLLGILVIAMFVITIKSDNPNILNYENVLVNRYAKWEQELSEREQKLREKEQELLLEEP